ncbi:MAG: aminoacyl-tRNA hydrolase [Gammaproteobacteria bacterium]|nr:aminoacyl-tRNA hydrolase [Gammaproteobacteria bacterium]
MAAAVALVAGLGNPGPRYADTRHNAGFWLLDRMAGSRGLSFRRSAKFLGEVAEADFDGRVWLLKPETFMNRSGQAVAALAGFYRIPPEQVLVVHDDLDLPPGTVRLKRGGGHGGHNGLRDILACLGSPDFLRLRVGVGHPGPGADVVGYVLNRPPAEEARLIDDSISRALELLPRLLSGEVDRVMNLLNAKPRKPAEGE